MMATLFVFGTAVAITAAVLLCLIVALPEGSPGTPEEEVLDWRDSDARVPEEVAVKGFRRELDEQGVEGFTNERRG